MYKVGITGGIATGKSTVSGILRELGVPVVDADAVSKALTAPGGAALSPIREAFGAEVFQGTTLNRAILAERIFADDAARERLNAIMFPQIRAGVLEALDALQAQGTALAAVDMPLLKEMGFGPCVDAVWLCDLPQEEQLVRLMARNHLTRAQAFARIESQAPQRELRESADVILQTGGSLAQIRAQVEAALSGLGFLPDHNDTP